MAVSGKDVEYQFVEALPEELTCSICKKVLGEPHLVNCCEKTFCKQCLDEWCRNNKTCPHCPSTDFSTILLKQKTRKVGELKVYCRNKQHGCKAELKISEYDSHLSLANNKGCSYVELDCPNDCKAKVFRGEMETHTREKCPKRVVSCEWCNLEGEYKLIVGDHVKTCPSFPLPCPLGCGPELTRKELESHRSTCPLEPVPCPFRGLGCKTKVCRKDLDKHIETSTPQHMAMLAESHTVLQAEHTALQAGYAAIQAGHAKLQVEHAELQNELDATKSLLSHEQIMQIRNFLRKRFTLNLYNPVKLTISDRGRQHITLCQDPLKPDYNFRLVWEPASSPGKAQAREADIKFQLYLTNGYPQKAAEPKFDADTKFDTYFNSHRVQVCCGKPQEIMSQEDNSLQLITTFNLQFPLLQRREVDISYDIHNRYNCTCPCHQQIL